MALFGQIYLYRRFILVIFLTCLISSCSGTEVGNPGKTPKNERQPQSKQDEEKNVEPSVEVSDRVAADEKMNHIESTPCSIELNTPLSELANSNSIDLTIRAYDEHISISKISIDHDSVSIQHSLDPEMYDFTLEYMGPLESGELSIIVSNEYSSLCSKTISDLSQISEEEALSLNISIIEAAD